MISAKSAIRSLRRDLTVSSLLKLMFTTALLVCLVAGPVYGSGWIIAVVVAIGAAWMALSISSVRGSSLSADSPFLIASGQYEEAEQHIEQALRGFSISRTAKLLNVHHLTMLRHAQRQWEESATLCRALLKQRLGSLQGLALSSRLMLADSLLELGDLGGAYQNIIGLYSHRLGLGDAMNLLLVQLDYESRIGAWEAMMRNMAVKVQMAELMPGEGAGRCQAFLALAALKTGRPDWADWLRSRVDLLMDTAPLLTERPELKEVWH